jgi:hypothetical protein
VCFLTVVLVGWIFAAGAADVKPSTHSATSEKATQSPVQVTLNSDGETWVSIENVRVPAKTRSITVALPPGDYQIVGRRTGYRDVEKSLAVRSGEPPVTLTIICTVNAQNK